MICENKIFEIVNLVFARFLLKANKIRSLNTWNRILNLHCCGKIKELDFSEVSKTYKLNLSVEMTRIDLVTVHEHDSHVHTC